MEAYLSYTGRNNPEDPGTRWNGTSYYIASPYASDGTPNPNYRATSYSGGSISNPLSDFDGRGNTDKILMQRGNRDYSTWEPSYVNEEDYSIVSFCDIYQTVGTSQGDWFLPSAGELGYFVARNNAISKAMIAIGSTVTNASSSFELASSSECNTSSFYCIDISDGSVRWHYKDNGCYAVAFCLI